MKREPTQEEREKIVRAITAGDRIRATSTYISITECGLTEAQKFIKALTTELELGNPENFAKRQEKRHQVRFWVS
jgi:ribosomal protein L7/L12